MARSKATRRRGLPVIGIDCSSERPESPCVNPEMAYLNASPLSYVQAVVRAGGLPILLPLVAKKDLVAQMLEGIDGLLLSGGYDVDPVYYGQEPDVKLGRIDVDKDRFENLMIPLALKKGVPILGICRGIQALNVFAGGTLLQDVSLAPDPVLKHGQRTDRCSLSHEIEVTPGTRLRQIFRRRRLRTNSYHHQVVDRVAPGFVVSARSRDGLVEAIEKQGDAFVLGFQPHPERLDEEFPVYRKLFRAFVDAAAKKK